MLTTVTTRSTAFIASHAETKPGSMQLHHAPGTATEALVEVFCQLSGPGCMLAVVSEVLRHGAAGVGRQELKRRGLISAVTVCHRGGRQC